MKKHLRFAFMNIYTILLTALLLISGCGGKADIQDIDNPVDDTDWIDDEFVLKTDHIPESDWFCNEYLDLPGDTQTEADYTMYDTALSEDRFVWLEKKYTATGARYFLGAGNEQINELTCDAWGIPGGYIRGMYPGGEGKLLFVVTVGTGVHRENQTAGFFLVKTDASGYLIEKKNIQDFLVERNLYSNGQYQIEVLGTDKRGYYYLNDLDAGCIYVLDSEGQFCMSESYLAGERKYSFSVIPTKGGELLFGFQSGDRQELFRLDVEKKCKKVLAKEFPRVITKWYGMEGKNIYYATPEALFQWNVSTGEQTKLITFERNGVKDLECSRFSFSQDHFELLVWEKEEGLYVLRFCKEETRGQNGISVVNISGGHSESLGSACTTFGRKNPALKLKYQSISEDAEIERILADVMNGNGPDLLNVSFEQMEALRKKDCLADYSGVINEEVLDNLRPGIRALAGEQGEIFGLPFCFRIETMFTSKEYWDKENWTPADVVDIVSGRQDIKGMFTDYFGTDHYFYNMFYLLGKGIRKAPYVIGTDGFDCQEFRNILSCVKEKTNLTTVEGSYWDIVAQEGYLGVPYYVYSLQDYYRVKKYLGEKGNLVGYPNYGGCGNYISTVDGGILVINQAAKDKPEVRRLLEYLFGEKCQSEIEKGIGVRKDIIIAATDEEEPYLKEYEAFLDSAVPDQSSEVIFDIIMEEADGFFQSDKSIDQVIDIIQRRVNLYLDEQ